MPSPTTAFDVDGLDRLMEESELDVVVATSPHNVQYLLGGYRFFFFEAVNALGDSRYLPIVVYYRGHLDASLYVSQVMEKTSESEERVWTTHHLPVAWGSMDAVAAAIEHMRKVGGPLRRIGIEPAFLPAEAKDAIAAAFPGSAIVDARRPLERLRAIKTPAELETLATVTSRLEGAVLATLSGSNAGITKRQMIDRVRREQFARGIDFSFCQVSFGGSLNRVPTDQVLEPGAVVSLDAVGSLRGYMGDLCRMGVAGEPDAELDELLAEVDEVQQTVRRSVRAGVAGGHLIAIGDAAVDASPHRGQMDFLVHGMGLVLHEAPRLVSGRPIPYAADDAALPLEVGMLLSVETSIRHRTRGYIKLEDTLAVTSDGCAAFGDNGRGWNRIGSGYASGPRK